MSLIINILAITAYYYSGMFDDEASSELEELRRTRMESFAMVVDSFLEGVKDGTVREDINPVMSTLVMLFSMNSVLSLTPVAKIYMEKYGLEKDRLFDYTMDMMLQTIENNILRSK